jgi:hypothetical protein
MNKGSLIIVKGSATTNKGSLFIVKGSATTNKESLFIVKGSSTMVFVVENILSITNQSGESKGIKAD